MNSTSDQSISPATSRSDCRAAPGNESDERAEFAARLWRQIDFLAKEGLKDVSAESQERWRSFLDAAAEASKDRSPSTDFAFMKRLRADMVAELPPVLRTEWQWIWRRYSRLEGFTSVTSLEGLADGRPEAWNYVLRFYPFIEQWFQRRGVASEAADMLTHEVFIEAWKSCSGYSRQQPGSTHRWLLVMARSTLAHYYRTENREKIRRSDYAESRRPESSEDERDQEEFREFLRADAHAVLRRMFTPRQVDVFLKSSEGRSVQSLADEFGVSLKTVYRDIREVTDALKRFYEKWRDEL